MSDCRSPEARYQPTSTGQPQQVVACCPPPKLRQVQFWQFSASFSPLVNADDTTNFSSAIPQDKVVLCYKMIFYRHDGSTGGDAVTVRINGSPDVYSNNVVLVGATTNDIAFDLPLVPYVRIDRNTTVTAISTETSDGIIGFGIYFLGVLVNVDEVETAREYITHYLS